MKQTSIKLSNEKPVELSTRRHDELQSAIIKDFAPRFAKSGELIYIDDDANEDFHLDKKMLKELNISYGKDSKLPNVIIYDKKKNWLYLIEAVTSHGPVSPKRIIELEELLKECNTVKIYVTAFPDFSEFKKHSTNIAWETEVWIADIPDHTIHYNGSKFMGPRQTKVA